MVVRAVPIERDALPSKRSMQVNTRSPVEQTQKQVKVDTDELCMLLIPRSAWDEIDQLAKQMQVSVPILVGYALKCLQKQLAGKP